MQNSDLASMQAIADRLDRPREPRPIKDIYSDALVKCPIDKGKNEMHEWAMAMAAVSSGICETASDMIAKVMARDVTVIAFAYMWCASRAAPAWAPAPRTSPLARRASGPVRSARCSGRLQPRASATCPPFQK